MEARDRRDALVRQGEYEQAGRSGYGFVTISEVAGEGRLVVGTAREQVNPAFAAKLEAGLQEGPDRVQAVVLVWCRRHRQPRVIGEQPQYAVDVRGDVRVGEAPCQISLLG